MSLSGVTEAQAGLSRGRALHRVAGAIAAGSLFLAGTPGHAERLQAVAPRASEEVALRSSSLDFKQGHETPNHLPLPEIFDRVARDTSYGLEHMRDPETGLLAETVVLEESGKAELDWRHPMTNIGIDLMLLSDELSGSQKRFETMEKVLGSIERFPTYRTESGGKLFFWQYVRSGQGFEANNFEVSSIDNLHLALGLYTASSALSERGPRGRMLGLRAKALFESMDFEPLLERETGLIRFALRPALGPDGKPTSFEKTATYSEGGSETRSLAPVLYAFQKQLLRAPLGEGYPEQVLSNQHYEFLTGQFGGKAGRILKTWDGGAFQVWLPTALFENAYSPTMRASVRNYAQLVLANAKANPGQPMVAFSACQTGLESYGGPLGHPELISSRNRDGQVAASTGGTWVATPHAVVIAAAQSPGSFASALKKLTEWTGKDGIPLYGQWGFKDSYTSSGKVTPIKLSLDELFLKLALRTAADPQGASPLTRAIAKDPAADAAFRRYYEKAEASWNR